MSKKNFTDVQISNPSENEVNMAFMNEADAVDFRIWWNRSGSKSFKNWKDKGDDFYNKKSEENRCKSCRRICVGQYCEKCSS